MNTGKNGYKGRLCILFLCLLGCFIFYGNMEIFPVFAAQEEADRQEAPDAEEAAGFIIDNQNIYEGMESSYSQGYVPKTEGEHAVLVLPLLSKGKIFQNRIRVAPKFTEGEHQPFVYKNYEKEVAFGYYQTGEKESGCYLVTFYLQLKETRYNGSYPVVLSVSAMDCRENEITQDFTVYVTIADGKETDAGGEGAYAENGTGIVIDSQKTYRGMEKSYDKGYIPKTGKEKAVLVLPLLAEHKPAGNYMTVLLKLGEGENLPFVYKNYEKKVSFGYHKTKEEKKKTGCYLAVFHLNLKKERYNGTYPVILSVRAVDSKGNEITRDFTLYVTITDGKPASGDTVTDTSDKLPQFAPKVMIASCKFSGNSVWCGKKSTAKLSLYNTSKTDRVKNMMITLSPDENVELMERTDSRYVEELGAGKTCGMSFAFRIKDIAPSGQYNMGITMDYADSRGDTYTVEGRIKISARQQAQIEFAPVSMTKNIPVGETVELQTQAMNLGKGTLYNVRAMVEADGLLPSGLAFMGNMEAGTFAAGSMELTAEGLSGNSLYGTTRGKIIFYYEDEMGNEMTQEQNFEVSILSPLNEGRKDIPADDTRHWWVVMAVIAVFLVLSAIWLGVIRFRGQKPPAE